MTRFFVPFFILILLLLSTCTQKTATLEARREAFIDSLVAVMTLEEKVGQLHFIVGDLFNTGPTVRTAESARFDEMIKRGQITGLFNIHGAAYTARLQKIALEQSRLKIPLIFGADIIHGFKTVTPLPLAEAASWDMELIEASARLAAREATAAGIHFNFAPMVDISRDARWGRVSEGAGEDPYLGSRIAEARVKGFQGADLSDPATMAACIKHFAAYGAPVAGRDYNTVDLSERALLETYLPPYEAGVRAGAATVMTSFNELNGIPASGNRYLLQDILRKQWGFNGMIVSDWQSISEMIIHGYSADSTEAAVQSMDAGVDMDMMGDIYLKKIPALVQQGKVDIKLVDLAVKRVLRLKYDLGLFDDPYRYTDTVREKNEIRSAANLELARDVARKSIVLLKNDGLLPLHKNYKTIAIIGPLGNNREDMNGSWSFFGEAQHPVSIVEGIQSKISSTTRLLIEPGCDLFTNSTEKFAAAKRAAQQADLVILAVGESAIMNGEGASRADIGLPGVQQQLVEVIHSVGKPTVVLLFNGRPLAIEWIDQNMPAIVETWTLGSQAGLAVADVLYGDYNPSGKLPMTFPRHVGQVPIYYNAKNTGRPYTGQYTEPLHERMYRSRYRDVKNTPLYPFGFGLSYSRFSYGNLILSQPEMTASDSITVSVTVKNEGPYDGEEVVQWYLRDHAGSVTRPVKELKHFEKIALKAGESRTVQFVIRNENLSFYRADMSWGSEPGHFTVFVGGDSEKVLNAPFALKP
jgi:beta-glucosidase